MHLVHVDEEGKPASVVGLRIEPSADPHYKSEFFEDVGSNLIGFNDTAVREGVKLSPIKAIEEVGSLKDYWTYRGSLTTPPCTEGIRWFVSAQQLYVSDEQMVTLLEAGRFSNRVEQKVWKHEVNV